MYMRVCACALHTPAHADLNLRLTKAPPHGDCQMANASNPCIAYICVINEVSTNPFSTSISPPARISPCSTLGHPPFPHPPPHKHWSLSCLSSTKPPNPPTYTKLLLFCLGIPPPPNTHKRFLLTHTNVFASCLGIPSTFPSRIMPWYTLHLSLPTHTPVRVLPWCQWLTGTCGAYPTVASLQASLPSASCQTCPWMRWTHHSCGRPA